MTDKYAKLREAALKATPGPWTLAPGTSEHYIYCDDTMGSAVLSVDDLYTPMIGTKQQKRNLAYAAATSPDVILELLAERNSLRDALRGMLAVATAPVNDPRIYVFEAARGILELGDPS